VSQTLVGRSRTKAAPEPAAERRPRAARVPSATESRFDWAFNLLFSAARRIPPLRLAALAAVVIVLLGVMGALEFFTSAHLGKFNLDGEGTAPAVISGGFLFLAALLGLAVARTGSWDRSERRALLLMAAFFTFMGIDEGLLIHERVGTLFHTHWQIPYLPVIAVAFVLWVRVLRALPANALAAKLWIAGAATWVGAQAFEVMQSAFAPQHEAVDGTVLPLHGAINLHFVFTIIEELGEMAGSALFMLSLFVLLRSRLAARPKRRRTHIAVPFEPETVLAGEQGRELDQRVS
jgi:hypothetical protein